MNPLYRRLRFPQRAENLPQFSTYQVDLEHWSLLAQPVRDRFEAIYERGESAVLLVHGNQGCGKTLFCDRLEADFQKASSGAHRPDAENLWHRLVGGSPLRLDTIRDATYNTTLRRVRADVGWFAAEQEFAKGDRRYKVRLFLIDDAHLDLFLCELAGVDLSWFRAQPDKQSIERGITQSLAENLVRHCRNDFQRSLFLLASNRVELFRTIFDHVERSHRGLALLRELPLPKPETKERIVRTNTNRLNNVSYWFCLDAAGPDEKKRVLKVLRSPEGFTDSFLALDEALKSNPRPGRPASRNTLTLVTLGSNLHDVRSFIDAHFESPPPYFFGQHLAAWQLSQWASLLTNGDAEEARRAELTESEFSFFWLALDPAAVASLCFEPKQSDLGQQILTQAIMVTPKPALLPGLASLDAQISPIAPGGPEQAWLAQFTNLGQRRSTLYEPALAQRIIWAGKPYSVGLPGFSSLRPDLTVRPYEACAITSAADEDKINDAIRRSAHLVEFTSFLDPQLDGLGAYILEKATRYALLLEAV